MNDDEPYLWRQLAYHLREADQAGSRVSGELEAVGCDLRWVEAKLCRLGPAAVEADLAVCQGERATLLREALAQHAHMLGQLDPEHALGATLLARLAGLSDLQDIVGAYEATFVHPRLAPMWPLPDLPGPALRRVLTGHQARLTQPLDGDAGQLVGPRGLVGVVYVHRDLDHSAVAPCEHDVNIGIETSAGDVDTLLADGGIGLRQPAPSGGVPHPIHEGDRTPIAERGGLAADDEAGAEVSVVPRRAELRRRGHR